MGKYDRIFKENIYAILIPLLEEILGITIKKSTEIKDKIQLTVEREADFLSKIEDNAGKEFILHIEFQVEDDPDMIYRMPEYRAMVQRKYKLPVLQFVIYLGEKAPKMRTELRNDEKITGFNLINVRDIPVKETLNSDVPEGIILSILSDYPESDVDGIIDKIIERLKETTKSQTDLRKYVRQLLILARLRKLVSKIKKKVRDMITYDVTTDELYIQGREVGKEEGIEQGIERGIKQNMYQMVSKAIEQGILTIEQIAEMAEVTPDQILEIKAKMENTR